MPTGDPILLNTTKFDGSLHYRFDATIVYQDERSIGLYREPNLLLESHRGSFVAPGHLLNVFFNDTYHNVAVMWDDEWNPRMHYVNIATPATWDSHRVTAADLDLDLIRFAGDEEIILDDEDEFEQHQVLMGYPKELIATCLAEVDVMRRAVSSKRGIFSDEIYDWRPESLLTQNHIAVPV